MAGVSRYEKECAAKERKVGIYVCHCGGNISDQVDVEKVCRKVKRIPGVTTVRSNSFMCSDPGQELIMEDIMSGTVDRVVVASCAPSLHEATFRNAVARAGGNPYVYEHANIREQVSWVHHGAAATEKAIRLISAATAKAKRLEPLTPTKVDAVKHATVIGGGIAGLKGAIDLARRGIEVALIEKSPFLGGRTASLDRLAPTGENAGQVVLQLAGEVLSHKLITVHTCARVSSYHGYVGNFRVGITREASPRNVDRCENGQPAVSGAVRGGFIPFLGVYAGNASESIEIGTAEEFYISTGVVLFATGFKPYEPKIGEYGFRRFREVVTLPDFIRMLAQARCERDILELNGRKIKSVAMIHCVGSRMIPGIHQEDGEGRLNEYCSRTCCSATLQASSIVRRTWPKTNVFEFYRDIRTYGRGQEELYVDASKQNVLFLRFSAEEPPVVEKNNDSDEYALSVQVKDRLTFGEEIQVPADLVVLSVGMEPGDVADLVGMMKLPVGSDRFLQEVHPAEAC